MSVLATHNLRYTFLITQDQAQLCKPIANKLRLSWTLKQELGKFSQ